MKKELVNLVYVTCSADIKGLRVIRKLIEYGGLNVECCRGENEEYCYFITPENIIYYDKARHIVPILKLAGYKDITAELAIEEYTIEEIAKMLGKDPESIRIKK